MDPDASQRFDTLARAQARLGGERALVLNLRDGFSDMRDILGYENALMALLTHPQTCHGIIERYTTGLIEI